MRESTLCVSMFLTVVGLVALGLLIAPGVSDSDLQAARPADAIVALLALALAAVFGYVTVGLRRLARAVEAAGDAQYGDSERVPVAESLPTRM